MVAELVLIRIRNSYSRARISCRRCAIATGHVLLPILFLASEQLTLRGNLSQNCRDFRHVWSSYEVLSSLKAPRVTSVYTIEWLNLLGKTLIVGNCNVLHCCLRMKCQGHECIILEFMERHCMPGRNEYALCAFLVNQRMQAAGDHESCDEFFTALNELTNT